MDREQHVLHDVVDPIGLQTTTDDSADQRRAFPEQSTVGNLVITADSKLVGVFASNLIMAQGAGQAVAENKLGDKLTLVGFDSDDKLVKLLSNGSIYALIVQDPFRMGYYGVKTALAVSNGEKFR